MEEATIIQLLHAYFGKPLAGNQRKIRQWREKHIDVIVKRWWALFLINLGSCIVFYGCGFQSLSNVLFSLSLMSGIVAACFTYQKSGLDNENR